MNTPEAQQSPDYAANDLPVANCDQEAWIKARILTAMRMAVRLDRAVNVGDEIDLFESGIEGVANGCAVTIIRILRMQPEFINLRRPYPSNQKP